MQRWLLISLLLAPFVLAKAQEERVVRNPYYDYRQFHYGFSVGLHTQDMLLTNSGFTQPNGDVWFAEIPRYSPGFSVGLLGDWTFNPFLSLRFVPSLHFGEINIKYMEQDSHKQTKVNLRSNSLQLPIELKIASLRLNNYRPYILAGGYGAINLGRKKGEILLLNAADVGVNIGFGCDFYMNLFKFAPEIRFSFGLLDMISKDRDDLIDKSLYKYTKALTNGKTRMITLIFNFE